MTTREELHHLVDHIPESEMITTRKILFALVDPVELAVLSAEEAEEDDEPETESELAAADAALSSPEPDIPFERLRRASTSADSV